MTAQGNSHGINLPKRFLDEHKIKKGQKLRMMFNGLLIIFPNEKAYQEYMKETNKKAVEMIDKPLSKTNETE